VNLPLKGSTMNTPTSVSNELSAPTVQGLHHFAWRCRDAEETRHFYEDLIGLPLVHVIRLDHVPSTGEYCPYVHIFFEMGDGSYIAFFDLGDDVSALPSPNTPAWVNHIALQVDSLDRLMALKARLEDAGVDVLGVTDHHIVKSIYFFDPNGFRVELTVRTVSDEDMKSHARIAHADLAKWVTDKAQLRASATTAPAQGN
jgi:catechol 2,3-dioxygenase-like lactoylglutathione lyase family enzyme